VIHTPKLVGTNIGLHPLAVIFALLAFGELFGFFGILLALPASAVLVVALKHVKQRYVDSDFYRGRDPGVRKAAVALDRSGAKRPDAR
jgi:predicted PurR-regulated permease PerM